MKWGGVILAAAVFAALPAAAHGMTGPMPPVYAPPAGDAYLVRGPLSTYVPATALASGSITIRVASANVPAAFALGKTLTFRVTTATRIAFDGNGQIRNSELGQVRLTSAARITTLAALQALPAATVVVERTPEQNSRG